MMNSTLLSDQFADPVEYADKAPGLPKAIDQMSADETGTTGDQHTPSDPIMIVFMHAHILPTARLGVFCGA